MPFCTDPALERLITQQFPAARAAGSFLPLDGLSGLSVQLCLEGIPLLARRAAGKTLMPGVNRQREYRLLRKLNASGLTPGVYGRNAEWLLLGWQPGVELLPAQWDKWLERLVNELVRLHRQPLTGYPVRLLPLLMEYWQRSVPSRRQIHWLRALKRCQQQGEPRPLRCGVLHMDIHCGNLIADNSRLRLIDWEYAGDGDVALELAAIVSGNELDKQQRQRLIGCYAAQQQFDYDTLQRQVDRWLPWLDLLATSWYELRWQQSGEHHFKTLAATGWQRISSGKR
ncbi:thiamine kinase [Erwinia sorbitola]|uniref:Thiamine kinase n=1 Tax=Erwinia sorbitola TaxID=2681984 RepID=A0A6I6EDU0_9GAMM|nr:thiamine kinase [Erwinia sorbitola]QGU88004.1 thiamine kinase [Erwinia sorbitola]